MPWLALDGYTLNAYKFPLGEKLGYTLHKSGKPINLKDGSTFIIAGDLFEYQFPAGLPFSLRKPHIAFVPEHGTQKVLFEDESDIGVIRGNVYPDFTFERLEQSLQNKPISKHGIRSVLSSLSQTEWERKFFENYASRFNMWFSKTPLLIPQAWIQWHSKNKTDLRTQSSAYADDLYRVDFVAFWNQKRFAILVDDISHYAIKSGIRWDASESAYSKRLKEDRKLRKEGWEVFRLTNWEVKNDSLLPEILSDLKEFIGFEEAKIVPTEEEIPF